MRRTSTPILFFQVAILLAFPTNALAQGVLVFEETFDTPASAGSFSVTSMNTVGNSFVDFAFDYSATGASRFTSPIGSAPSGGSQTGLLIAVNNGLGPAGFNFIPDIPLFTVENYRLTFDFWAGVNNVNQGTSEYVSFGANTTPANYNGDLQLPGFDATRRGDWIEANAPGDVNSDYVTFTRKLGTKIAETFLGNTDPGPMAAYPDPPGPFLGAPGERWSTLEVVRTTGLTEFYFNDVLVANVVDGEDLTPGLPWVGYSDLFASVAGGETSNIGSGLDFDPFAASFGLIDNVRVFLIPEPDPCIACSLAALLLIGCIRGWQRQSFRAISIN